ncbi:MAG: formyltransferase family protein, partial [Flavobacteriaceae bacterium]
TTTNLRIIQRNEAISSNIIIIVLASYMQIILVMLISKFFNKIINIQHSFLPAFVRVTSHYVT